MKLITLVSLAILSVNSALASETKSYCDEISISDRSTEQRSYGNVRFTWYGPLKSRTFSKTSDEGYYNFSRADRQPSKLGALNVKILKAVPFESYQVESPDPARTAITQVSTLKLEVSSDEFEVGNTASGGIGRSAKAAVATVVCYSTTLK